MNKNKTSNFHGFWSLSILICIVAVVFSFFFVACSREPASTQPPANTGTASGDENPSPTDETPPPEEAPPPVILAESEDMGQSYIDSIIFLGDSTTNGLRFYGVLSGGKETKQVWVPSNATFSLFNQDGIKIVYPETGEETLIEDAVAQTKPEYMVLTLGVNGVSMMEEDWFKREYIALIERIQENSPGTKIILNSIYPVGKEYQEKSITNELIDRANQWVLEIAAELGLRYLNTASILKDDEGYLRHGYDNSDGIHLEGETLRLVLDYIRTHGYR